MEFNVLRAVMFAVFLFGMEVPIISEVDRHEYNKLYFHKEYVAIIKWCIKLSFSYGEINKINVINSDSNDYFIPLHNTRRSMH